MRRGGKVDVCGLRFGFVCIFYGANLVWLVVSILVIGMKRTENLASTEEEIGGQICTQTRLLHPNLVLWEG